MIQYWKRISEKNIGKLAIYLKGKPQERLVRIVGVQKLWDHNEEGQYVFGIHGYTVEELQHSYITVDGETHRLYGIFACSKKRLSIMDEGEKK